MPLRKGSRFPRYPHKPHKKGQARIFFEGRTIYLGPFQSTESWRKYHALRQAWESQRERRRRSAQPSWSVIQTVNDLVAAWWEHAESYYRDSPAELDHHRQTLRALSRLHGDDHIEEFGPRALKTLREAMLTGSWLTPEEIAARPPHHRIWSRRVVNNRINRIRHMFKWAASEELIPDEVYRRLTTVEGLRAGRCDAVDYDPVKPVPLDVVKQTIARLHPVIGAMVRLQLATGMRPGEVVLVRPMDIDKEQVIEEGRTIWVYRPQRHKTQWRGYDKTVVIGPRGQEVLEPFLATKKPHEYCFSPRDVLRRLSGYRPSGEHYTTSSYGRRIRETCRRHGIPEWHPHQLRHTAATLIGSAFDLDSARTVLGQQDVRVTALYAERDLKKAAEIVAKIG